MASNLKSNQVIVFTSRDCTGTSIFSSNPMWLLLIGKLSIDVTGINENIHYMDFFHSLLHKLSLKFQVKGLLKEKKLETLVDADLQGNYVDEEVEQLIQVALLCTQTSPMERPKMSDVVRMLEGDGLAERWEEWQKEEMFRQEINHTPHPNTDWIIADSTSNLRADELSGPR